MLMQHRWVDGGRFCRRLMIFPGGGCLQYLKGVRDYVICLKKNHSNEIEHQETADRSSVQHRYLQYTSK